MIMTSTSAGTAVVVGIVEVMVWDAGCGMGLWWRKVREQTGSYIYGSAGATYVAGWLII